MDGLGLLELRSLPVDDHLGDILHEPGPAQALRHLDDGELALAGKLDDVGGHVLDEARGLDEQGGGAGHHHPATEVALPFEIAFDREHGREDHLPPG